MRSEIIYFHFHCFGGCQRCYFPSTLLAAGEREEAGDHWTVLRSRDFSYKHLGF